jgi:hypothetical protein
MFITGGNGFIASQTGMVWGSCTPVASSLSNSCIPGNYKLGDQMTLGFKDVINAMECDIAGISGAGKHQLCETGRCHRFFLSPRLKSLAVCAGPAFSSHALHAMSSHHWTDHVSVE